MAERWRVRVALVHPFCGRGPSAAPTWLAPGNCGWGKTARNGRWRRTTRPSRDRHATGLAPGKLWVGEEGAQREVAPHGATATRNHTTRWFHTLKKRTAAPL